MNERDGNMKFLFCGDRHWTNIEKIREILTPLLREGDIVIHGGAPGVDTICGNVAKELGFIPRVFQAMWERYGDAAGPIRNSMMLKEKPDIVYAFHNNIEHSKGTKDTVDKAKKKGIPVIIITE